MKDKTVRALASNYYLDNAKQLAKSVPRRAAARKGSIKTIENVISDSFVIKGAT
jgi:hypothetical protein